MLQKHFVVDEQGNKVGVFLAIAEYEELLDELEELESLRAYDAAKASGETPEPFETAVREIENRG